MQKITYLNGERLHRAVTVGIHKVISKQEYLNKINVFGIINILAVSLLTNIVLKNITKSKEKMFNSK